MYSTDYVNVYSGRIEGNYLAKSVLDSICEVFGDGWYTRKVEPPTEASPTDPVYFITREGLTRGIQFSINKYTSHPGFGIRYIDFNTKEEHTYDTAFSLGPAVGFNIRVCNASEKNKIIAFDAYYVDTMAYAGYSNMLLTEMNHYNNNYNTEQLIIIPDRAIAINLSNNENYYSIPYKAVIAANYNQAAGGKLFTALMHLLIRSSNDNFFESDGYMYTALFDTQTARADRTIVNINGIDYIGFSIQNNQAFVKVG